MPPALLAEVEARMKTLGRRNFSDYARSLIQNDLAERGDLDGLPNIDKTDAA